MTVFRHELGQGRNALLIWTGAIGFLLTVCVFLFPEIQGEMNTVGNVFASMGSFTAAGILAAYWKYRKKDIF